MARNVVLGSIGINARAIQYTSLWFILLSLRYGYSKDDSYNANLTQELVINHLEETSTLYSYSLNTAIWT